MGQPTPIFKPGFHLYLNCTPVTFQDCLHGCKKSFHSLTCGDLKTASVVVIIQKVSPGPYLVIITHTHTLTQRTLN